MYCHCSHCGTQNQVDAPYCVNCGQVLVQLAQPPLRLPDLGQDPAMRLLLPVGRSLWAIAAGYLGLFAMLCFPAPIALVVSIVAIGDIRRHPDRHGMGRAVFGLVMGILGTCFLVFMVVVLAINPK
jgi:hypothetical protein